MTPAPAVATPLARYRAMEPGDVAFVFNSWLKSYGKTLPLSEKARASYLEAWHELVGKLLKRSQVLVACDPRTPSEIWAYLCFEEKAGACVVHWVYTRQLYRRWGLARRLVEMAHQVTPGHMENSHRTEAWARLGRRFRSRFNPDAAR